MANEWKKEVVDRAGWLSRLPTADRKLYSMYSSVTDCIVTDPTLMTLPIDDHMVHRGDGVFESFKCLDGAIYNLGDHLDRLELSCEALGIEMPMSLKGMADVIVQTTHAGGHKDALIRLLVSRGLGTMGVNPYDCLGTEFYVVVYELQQSRTDTLPEGVKLGLSKVPIKPGMFARVKTCNYLPNVLMKKEAVDMGVDYTVTLDENRYLAEGATENIGIVTRGKELFMPPLDRTLAGTTAKRAMEFAMQLKQERVLTNAEFRPINLGAARSAAEVHIYGTTPNVTPVTAFDGSPVGNGVPGPIAKRLFEMLRDEMIPESTRLTQVFN